MRPEFDGVRVTADEVEARVAFHFALVEVPFLIADRASIKSKLCEIVQSNSYTLHM
jgi:hypothetical protein